MNVRAIGSVAAELLEQPHSAVVQGITRQGIFLRLDPVWVIFLSREAERGPLTVNVEDESGFLNSLSIGDQVPIPAEAEIVSPSTAGQYSPGSDIFKLDTRHTQVWSAPPRPAAILTATERKFTVAAIIRQAQNIRPTASLTAFQAVLDRDLHAPEGDAGLFHPYLSSLKALLSNRQRPAAEAIISPLRQPDPHSLFALLGLGRGLTPSGDDIVLGLLLALNRWRSELAHGLDVTWINRNILAQAYQRTTTISANLIECAARGQADERLVTALDGIMTGLPGTAEAASLLASWGSSSGLDALCGMAVATA